MYMSNPKISIIVPIYKAESTLLRCLNTLKAQTLTDFEVLMVDDGSPDRCGEMIDEYAAKDVRFKAYHKPNGGVSSSRQFGIDHAVGEYTIHADPDDWVEPTMLEELYRKAKEEDDDMVICDYWINTTNQEDYVCQEPISLRHDSLLKELFGRIHGSCWNKLIKKDLYNQYSVRFPLELSFCEDQYVIASFLKHDMKVGYMNKAFYHYYRSDSDKSLSRKYSEEQYRQDVNGRNLFVALLENTSASEVARASKNQSLMNRAFFLGNEVFSSKRYRKEFFSTRKDVFKKGNHSELEKILIYLSCFGLYQVMYKLYYFIRKWKKNCKA